MLQHVSTYSMSLVIAVPLSIDPFLSIRFPWYYWRSSAEAWRPGSIVARTHFTTTPRVTVQCVHVTLRTETDLQAQHLTSSMTIPRKPDAQKGLQHVSTYLTASSSLCLAEQ